MPTSASVMVNWCVNVTWTPVVGTYSAKTVVLRYKAAANNAAYVTTQAQTQTQDLNTQNPVTLSAPYLDPDQNW